MKQKVLDTILAQVSGINIKKLMKKISIDINTLEEILLELRLDGKILLVENKYITFPDNLYLGKIINSSTGKKYISFNDDRIDIDTDFINRVVLNDVVVFELNDMKKAEIISVIKRELGTMPCEVIDNCGKKTIVPYYDGIKINLSNDVMNILYDGDIILVDISSSGIDDYSSARFIKKIGRRDDPSMDDVMVAMSYGFDNEYSDEYLNEVNEMPNSISEDEIVSRVDFRYQNCFTIDGVYSKDMDDCVYGEFIDDNVIRVYVHIADVSHYVKNNSLVFARACEKTTSLYMNNTVFPMLHSILSNGICSLCPNVDRLTKTVIMDIDSNGKIINFNVVRSIIKSKMKMNYDDCDLAINGENIPDGYDKFLNEISILYNAMLRLEKRYVKNGKLEFANTEEKIVYDNNNNIDSISDSSYSVSAKIIENLMIAANETVALWLFNMQIPAIYRVLEQPSSDKINQAIDVLNRYGYRLKKVGNVEDSRTIQILLNKIRDYEAYPLISQLLVMSMQRAIYSTKNVGHYALGCDAYLHFTSPIRRLPDLLVHSVIDMIYDNKIFDCDFEELERYLEKFALHSSTMERQADMAEADGRRRLIVEKMSSMIGMETEATICEVGKLIRVKVMGIDTYVKESNLSSNFIFDSKRKLYYDTVNLGYLTLGTRINVKISYVNVINRSVLVDIVSVITANDNINSNVNNVVKKKTLKM